ncbi:MAG TPA: bifunctional DNA-formamidopyrimidine glycosylase/DNA-(apurinic or apyrimidinic site) lyase [Gemmatimonadales bacterium]|nr:bifunctional DNA-formamidopyrimidine glycosylase/DNA-(apurinic or apyrimidinic site) lyase [Gemmatimonadales bacterium]
MPELPEVETIARDVRPHLEGATIRRVRVIKPDILRSVTHRAFERGVRGRRCVRVWRRAKHLVLDLDDGRRVVIQPRMTGALLVGGESDPYDVIELLLDTGVRIRYRDVRRLGAVFLLTARQWLRYDAAIGPEPLEPGFTADVFARILSRGAVAVKKAIMDQKRVAGVGNIYANEALWMAGLDPSRPARSLRREEAERLHAAIVDVLKRSIAGRGTTIRDFRTGTGEAGSFQGNLAVYERVGEPCLRCRGGKRIALTHAIDGRATYFCAGCQR